jgi:ABC-type branched-subunit amino acid transport system substrate-binding protein
LNTALLLGLLAYAPARGPQDATVLTQQAGTTSSNGSEAGGPIATAAADVTGSSAGPGAAPTVQQGAQSVKSGAQCAAGQNGGTTDTGVTAKEIKLASTIVISGPGKSFLGDSPKAMQAVIQRVNKDGGICGRILNLTLRDDGWDANTGQDFIRNWIKGGMFSLPVVPSSEGLGSAIKAGDISGGRMPVVGTDGMRIDQYEDPWVWPVATATVSTMRVMAKYAYEQKGARTFGIVWDNRYKFGVEGAKAFRDFVKTLPGATLKADVGIEPTQSSYNSEIQTFNSGCGAAGCDMVALLLVPSTAEVWVAGNPSNGKKITSGAQTLFNRRFAENCKSWCNGMYVWTGYTPPIGPLASLPGVAQFVRDVQSLDPTVDTTNAFLEGAYLGMSVFVEALKRVGPNLTRAALQQTLDAMDYETDLASKLSWRSGKHHANVAARAFTMVIANNSFAGWADAQTNFIKDPAL